MGKSEKKGKSDRINTLRKQYDAFLEEDKKRKERNDYILGRLDKMRVCTAVVPLRHMPDQYDNNRPTYHMPAQLIRTIPTFGRPAADYQPRSPLDLSSKLLEGTDILKEISKKYILIPKTRTYNEVQYNIPASNIPEKKGKLKQDFDVNNADWKNKYEILEQLKELEKEEPVKEKKEVKHPEIKTEINNYDVIGISQEIPSTGEQYMVNNKIDSQEIIDSHYIKFATDNFSEPFAQNQSHQSFSPSKEVPVGIENSKYEQKYNPMLVSQTPDTDLAPKYDGDFNNDYPNAYEEGPSSHQNYEMQLEHPNNEPVLPISDAHQDYAMDHNEVQHHDDTVVQEHHIPQVQKYADNIETIHNEGIHNVQELVHHDKDELMHTINPTELVEEIHKNQEPNISKDPGLGQVMDTKEKEKYPIKAINAPDFTPSDIQLVDGQNINPESQQIHQNIMPTHENSPIENIVSERHEQPTTDIQDNSQIDEFEAEQRNMFYSEQQETEAIDDTNYSQNENEQYAYYEGQLEQQNYPVEINEHVESTERYDQNYEEQYANQYDPQQYEQQNYEQTAYDPNAQQYDPTGQVYDPPQQVYQEGYDQTQPLYDQNQPEYEQNPEYEMQYDQNYETQENMEQQLDYEQGYVPERNDQEQVQLPVENQVMNPVEEKAPAPQVALEQTPT